jgi:hypothetical protein
MENSGSPMLISPQKIPSKGAMILVPKKHEPFCYACWQRKLYCNSRRNFNHEPCTQRFMVTAAVSDFTFSKTN